MMVAEIDAIMNAEVKSNGPGAAIAVVKDRSVVHRLSYGLANVDCDSAKYDISPGINHQTSAELPHQRASRRHSSFIDPHNWHLQADGLLLVMATVGESAPITLFITAG